MIWKERKACCMNRKDQRKKRMVQLYIFLKWGCKIKRLSELCRQRETPTGEPISMHVFVDGYCSA